MKNLLLSTAAAILLAASCSCQSKNEKTVENLVKSVLLDPRSYDKIAYVEEDVYNNMYTDSTCRGLAEKLKVLYFDAEQSVIIGDYYTKHAKEFKLEGRYKLEQDYLLKSIECYNTAIAKIEESKTVFSDLAEAITNVDTTVFLYTVCEIEFRSLSKAGLSVYDRYAAKINKEGLVLDFGKSEDVLQEYIEDKITKDVSEGVFDYEITSWRKINN